MTELKNMTIGVVGLGLMGASIASAMALFGYKVIGVSPVDTEVDRTAPERMRRQIEEAIERKLVKGSIQHYFDHLKITNSYSDLATCDLVVESVIENLEVKKEVLQKIEAAVRENTIISTNTFISLL